MPECLVLGTYNYTLRIPTMTRSSTIITWSTTGYQIPEHYFTCPRLPNKRVGVIKFYWISEPHLFLISWHRDLLQPPNCWKFLVIILIPLQWRGFYVKRHKIWTSRYVYWGVVSNLEGSVSACWIYMTIFRCTKYTFQYAIKHWITPK